MSDQKQLQTLIKTWEIEEQKAQQQKQSIRMIVEEREKVYNSILSKKNELATKIADLGGKLKKQALQKGDKEFLQTSLVYKEKLKKELLIVDKEEVEKLKELKMAQDRLSRAQKELEQVVLEKQKIEKLLEKKQIADMMIKTAKDENAIDELNNSKIK